MTTVADIIAWFEKRGSPITLGNKVNVNQAITRPKAIDEAVEEHVTFISSKYKDTYTALLQNTDCKCVIIDQDLFSNEMIKQYADVVFIPSENPKQDLTLLIQGLFNSIETLNTSFIHPTASISPQAIIGEKVHVAAYAVIEGNVTIGNNSNIGAGSVIKSNTVIGENVVIGANNVLGGDGFGYVKNEATQEYELFPHLGGLVIEDHVHIGNNTCIDRGSLKDTIIHQGVKIDNLVHIAHNVTIGKNSLIIACSMIAGSVVIGENCWVAPSSSVRNGIYIGDNTTIGLGSVVTKSVGADETVAGNPAVPLAELIKLRQLHTAQLAENSKEE
ncbi:MAG: DapH/DapD/GlmU-related protein [Bacteroidia bacterium]|jgi:UDP-3-O-[3-hydroxymyristoyl] glucosamine N-acyltransferase